jgi:hypothetical protein
MQVFPDLFQDSLNAFSVRDGSKHIEIIELKHLISHPSCHTRTEFFIWVSSVILH